MSRQILGQEIPRHEDFQLPMVAIAKAAKIYEYTIFWGSQTVNKPS
jgi:hypothetical protein